MFLTTGATRALHSTLGLGSESFPQSMPSMNHRLFLDYLLDFLREEDGPTAVEYAVMLALIIAVCAGSVSFLATQTQQSFDDSAAAIAGAIGN